jgi:hypothetical protein
MRSPDRERHRGFHTTTVRTLAGRPSSRNVFLWESILRGAFVWARGAPNRQERRLPAPRATACLQFGRLLTVTKCYSSPFYHSERPPARAVRRGRRQAAADGRGRGRLPGLGHLPGLPAGAPERRAAKHTVAPLGQQAWRCLLGLYVWCHIRVRAGCSSWRSTPRRAPGWRRRSCTARATAPTAWPCRWTSPPTRTSPVCCVARWTATRSGPAPGRLSALRVSHSESVFYGVFCMGARGA